MLLVIDVGNSHTVLGLYRETELVAHWRVMTTNYRTTDEVRILLAMLFQQEGFCFGEVKGCCVSSVVPPVNFNLEKACRRAFGIEPLFVGPGVRTGLSIVVENPKEVGADRIANAVGALAEYPAPLILVDYGTATTLDAVSARAEYLGGAILPGIQISANALFERCAMLPRIEIARPPSVIGRNTIDHIRSGLTYGYADLIDGMITRMIREMEGAPTIVATGGFATLMSTITTRVHHVDPNLTLKGLRAVYLKNRPEKGAS